MRFSSVSTAAVLPVLLASAQNNSYNPNTTFPAQSNQGGSFIEPPNGITSPSDYSNNPVYHVGDQFNISWTAEFPSVDLLLCAPALNGEWAVNVLQHNVTETSFSWIIQSNPVPGTNLIAPDLFFMLVNNQSDSGAQYFTSHFFNITNATATTNSATTTPSALSSSSAAASASMTSNANSAMDPKDSTAKPASSISGGAIAGIVIGVLAAVAIAAAAAWFFLIRPRRRGMAGATAASVVASVVTGPPAPSGADKYAVHPGEAQKDVYASQTQSEAGSYYDPAAFKQPEVAELQSQYYQQRAAQAQAGQQGSYVHEADAAPPTRDVPDMRSELP